MAEDIKGLDALLKKFDAHPAVMQREGLVKGVKKGGALIRDAASQRAPHGETGELSSGMTVKVEQGGIAEVRALIGPSKKAFYGRFLERGTKHQHAEPFLKPAFDEKQSAAVDAIADSIREVVDGENR